jgi:P-type Cu2+ transporter
VLFDKTGTLTEGARGRRRRHRRRASAEDELLALAGAVEADSEHPLARAIHAYATERVEVPTASGFRSMTGRGVTAEVDGVEVAVGGPALLRDRTSTSPTSCRARPTGGSSGAPRSCTSSATGQVIGAFALEDRGP